MDLFVTGGTGFVGCALIRELIAQRHAVRVLVRPGRPRPTLKTSLSIPVRWHEANPWDLDALIAGIRGADAVIHLVGIISEVGKQTFARVHTELTQQILAGTHKAGVARFVHMSALGTRAGARSRYHQTKWAAEQEVLRSPLNWTIFRPSLIYGREDAFTNTFAGLARWSPAVPVFGEGTNQVQPIAVEQVARAFAAAAVRSESIGQVYDLCGPERLSFCELLREILRAMKRRRLLVHIPWTLARWQAAFLECVFPRLLRRAPPLNRDQLRMLQEDNVGDGTRADQTFALVHEPFAEAIRHYL